MWFVLFTMMAVRSELQQQFRQVPVLCYHHITADNEQPSSVLFIQKDNFQKQLQALADSGYRHISPDDLYSCLQQGKAPPPKSIIITFDDSHAGHFSIAAPILEQAGFRGVFFIMTVTIGKKGYLSAREINALHQQGHTIGSHTWDHPRIQGEDSLPDANRQLRQSKATLEKITGAPVTCLAYPFGSWNEATVSQLQKAGFHLAFQLSSRRASRLPQYTIRRIMVDGRWQGQRLLAAIRQSF